MDQLYVDAQEPPVEALEPAFGVLIGELPTVHLEKMASGRQRLANSGEVGGGGTVGCGEYWSMVRLRRTLTSGMELALQVLLSDLHVAQSHADVFVAEQLLESRKTDAETDHFGGKGMPQPMCRHRAGTASPLAASPNASSRVSYRAYVATVARQQQAFGLRQSRWRGQRAQGQNAGHDAPSLCIGWNQAFGVQFAERDMQRPLVRSELAQTVQGQIDALADTDSSGASKQEALEGRSSVRRNSCCSS